VTVSAFIALSFLFNIALIITARLNLSLFAISFPADWP